MQLLNYRSLIFIILHSFLISTLNRSLNIFLSLSSSLTMFLPNSFFLHCIVNYIAIHFNSIQKKMNLKVNTDIKFITHLFYFLPAMNCLFLRGDRGCRWYSSLDLYRSKIPMLSSTVFCIKSTTTNPLQFPKATLREKKCATKMYHNEVILSFKSDYCNIMPRAGEGGQ